MIIQYIRHGKTEANTLGLASGCRVDRDLSFEGIREIELLKEKGIYPKEHGKIYSSNLKRTRQTLEIIYGRDIECEETELLKEIDFGELEYMNPKEFQAVVREFLGEWEKGYTSAEGGETLMEFKARVEKSFIALLKIIKKNGYELVTIGGHGAYLNAMNWIWKFGENAVMGEGVNNGMGVIFDADIRENDEVNMKIIGFMGGDSWEAVHSSYR